ncbi:hypothetical protein [Marinilabilia sp.]|jgi:intracellular septation protein A
MRLSKIKWPIFLLAIIVGLMNTVFIKSEDIGTWKNFVGYGFLLIAIVDALFLIRQYLTKKAPNNE